MRQSGKPYLQDPDLTIWNGDVREVLRELPDESVQMCVTSPPYWGLRDYGTGAWEGGKEGCDHVKTTHRREQPERPKGWDGNFRYTSEPIPVSYSAKCGKCGATRLDNQIGLEPTPDAYVSTMVEVFREVRRVLRKDGTLWLNIGDSYAASMRGDNRSVEENLRSSGLNVSRDRSKSQSQRAGAPNGAIRIQTGLKPKDLCMIPARVALALQADGWYLRSEITWCKPNPMPESVADRPTQATEKVYLLSKSARYFYDAEAVREPHALRDPRTNGGNWAHIEHQPDGSKAGHHSGAYPVPNPAGRNLRNWWEIATEPYPEAHFATYPTELVRRCILAGSAEGDIVLDPFGGSGTTAYVARKLGRRTILVELSADYCALAAKRTQQLSLEAVA